MQAVSRSSRQRLVAAASVAAMVAGAAAGCAGATGPGTANPEADTLAKLTAVATGGAASAGITSSVGAIPVEPGAELEADIAYQLTQEAINSAAEIAPIRDKVKRQEPLATFTPDPEARRSSGDLLYLRTGKFYVASADGESIEPLALDDPTMPSVWSPPEDPGRAWISPTGDTLAVFAGRDANLWLLAPDGSDNRSVSGPNLPTLEHEVTAWSKPAPSVRLLPGRDYTIVAVQGTSQPYAVLVDDNSRHVRGEGRLRVVHAVTGEADTPLVVFANGQQLGSAVPFGRSTGDQRVVAGMVQLVVKNETGDTLAELPLVELADRDLKTVFLYGDEALQATEAQYAAGDEAAAGSSRVRVFNAGSEPASIVLDGDISACDALPIGALGPYVTIAAVASNDDLTDIQQTIYGLRAYEEPVGWSADGKRVAFLGGGTGRIEVYAAALDGQARQVTDDEWLELNPVWSTDGRNLAWIALDEGHNEHHLMVAPGGGKPMEVDLAAMRAAMGWQDARIQLARGAHWIDGTRLCVFPSVRGIEGGIWLYDVGTQALAPAYDGVVEDAQWSVQANAWVFDGGDEDPGIYVLPLDGEPRRLVEGEAHGPLWSPDGRFVSYGEGETASPEGWRLHVVSVDGSTDRALTDWLPVVQQDPPVPGPRAKRFWIGDGADLVFSMAGTDYGAADEAGAINKPEAGDDIENLWLVPSDGSAAPTRLTDLTRVYYMRDVTESPGGGSLGFAAFSYLSRSQQLWTVATEGGKPTPIDGPVRWFMWLE